MAFRSKTHLTKKQYGLNKTRTKTSTGPIIGEVWESSADDSVLGGVSSIPIIFQKQIDLGDSNSGTNGRSLHLPLEKLEFGSFGPGFLAKGLHDANINKDGQFIFQSQQQLLHSDSSLPIEGISISQAQLHPLNSSTSGSSSREVTSKGHHTDEPQRYVTLYLLTNTDK